MTVAKDLHCRTWYDSSRTVGTVGLSDCRSTVGTVGILSEYCRTILSDCRTGAQQGAGRIESHPVGWCRLLRPKVAFGAQPAPSGWHPRCQAPPPAYRMVPVGFPGLGWAEKARKTSCGISELPSARPAKYSPSVRRRTRVHEDGGPTGRSDSSRWLVPPPTRGARRATRSGAIRSARFGPVRYAEKGSKIDVFTLCADDVPALSDGSHACCRTRTSALAGWEAAGTIRLDRAPPSRSAEGPGVVDAEM